MLSVAQLTRPGGALGKVAQLVPSQRITLTASGRAQSAMRLASRVAPKAVEQGAKRMLVKARSWKAVGVKRSLAGGPAKLNRAFVRGMHSSTVALDSDRLLSKTFQSDSASIERAFEKVEMEGNQHGARHLGGKVNTILNICPQQEVWIVERLGKYMETAEGGMHLYVPFLDSISYRFSLKEQAIIIPSRSAITKDNVRIHCIGVLYYKIVDPKAAAYGCGNPVFALSQLAQTSLRSVLGRLTLDETFHERTAVNSMVVDACNDAAKVWGITCLRHEIREIQPPENVIHAMEMQMSAERRKRVDILQSEGEQQALINRAEAHKREVILHSEAQKLQDINIAEGQATSTRIKAEAERDAAIASAEGAAQALERIASSTSASGGPEAIQFELASKYIESLSHMAKTNNTMIVPANVSDVASMLSQATTIYQRISDQTKKSL